MILLYGSLLLLYPSLLGFKDGNLLSLAFNLPLLLFIFFSELGNVLVTVTHNFGIEIKESSILDQTLLELVILLEQFSFFGLELEFLLSELFLFVDVRLLVLVHLASFVKQACRR